jgi:hypothetical protein
MGVRSSFEATCHWKPECGDWQGGNADDALLRIALRLHGDWSETLTMKIFTSGPL